MTSRTGDPNLRALLDSPSPREGLAVRVLHAVLARRGGTAPEMHFDVTASDAGIVSIRPGRGEIQADSAAARQLAERARQQLAEYLAGARSYFTVPTDQSALGDFESEVLERVGTIPFGEIRTYRWIAEKIGRPRAMRAVGEALGRNPVPIVVPCHRVLRSDGALGGYRLGPELKRQLLDLEKETPWLVGSDTTRIVCRRGCIGEQRITEPHRVVFGSVDGALSAGYRACCCLDPVLRGDTRG